MATSPASPAGPRPRIYVVGFLLFCAVVALIGVRSYLVQRAALETTWRQQIEEIVEVKVRQLADWRAERLGDAAVASTDTPLMPAVQQVLASADAGESLQRVRVWMDAVRTNYQYANIVLIDAAGRIKLSSGQLFGLAAQYAALAAETRSAGRVVLRDVPGPPAFTRQHFTLVVGLREGAATEPGTLLLGIDPAVALYRSILVWPASRTGELVLVRRDDDAVVYLSPVRYSPGASMAMREAAAAQPTPIGRAVFEGTHVEGDDTSGKKVLTWARPIPGSSWFVVAKIDRDEAYEPLRELAIRLLEIGGLLVFMCGVGVTLGWRHERETLDRQRREAEIERRALRGHYEFLTRFGNDAILLLDGDGLIVEVNDRVVEWFGYSREELLTMHSRQLLASDTVEEFDRAWEATKSQRRLLFETTDRRKDGSLFPVEVSVRIIEIEGRQFCQSIVRDISERRRAEEQIRRVNRLYAVLSECSHAIVASRTEMGLFERVCHIAVDPGGFRLASISLLEPDTSAMVHVARAGASVGYLDALTRGREGFLPQGSAKRSLVERRAVICHDILHDPAMTVWKDEAASFGLRSSIALPLRRRGTEVGVLELYAGEPDFFTQAEATLAEEVAESVSFALDSIEREARRQQADTELRISRDRLERVLDAIDEGYWDWRPATGNVHLSARYHTMLGYVPGELPFGWDAWLAMTHPEDVPVAEAAFKRFLESRQETFAAEYRMRCKSGEYIWVLSRGKVVDRDSTGTPTRMVGTQTDITERKKLEDQFLQSQKLESVGRLAGGIAHDFNNLLTVINGYSEIVLGKLGAGDPCRPHVDAIRQSGERAAALTQQLLAFSRKQASQPRALALNAAVREYDRLLQPLVGEELELVLRLDAADDHVVADPSQLHQVVMNLVVNARDATPAGGRVLIHTANAMVKGDEAPDITPGPYVVLSVTDTGTGMDEETRAQIFEPFFTTKERGKGTGLGLSTVYGIVRQSGGFVRVDSQLGRGTTFAIYLPLTTIDVAAAASHERPTRLFGSETILVVEDQPAVRTLAVEALRGLGYSVLAASDGTEALRLADEHSGPIHVLLTDVVMPGLDGKATADRLSATRPDTKIVYMSGYTDDVIGLRGVLDAGVAYLPKPFTADALATKIREVLGVADAVPRAVRADRPTVLVVDDDESVRQLFTECLDAEYRVLQAGDGEEAVEVVRRERDLDLVITDLFMPKQAGVETIQAVRELRPGLRVIAISGAFGGQFLKLADRLGVDATLLKPIRLEVLRHTVDEVLSRTLRVH